MSAAKKGKHFEFLLTVRHKQIERSDVSAIGALRFLLVTFNEKSKTSKIKFQSLKFEKNSQF